MTSVYDHRPERRRDDGADVDWLLEGFTAATPGVEGAIGVSSDGLLIAVSSSLNRATMEKLAAAISALTSLAVSTARLLAKGSMHQVIIEFGAGYLLVTAIRDGSCLGVVTERGGDLGLIGYESAMLVQRVGALLTPQLVERMKARLVQ